MAGNIDQDGMAADASLAAEDAARLHAELVRIALEANRAYFTEDAPLVIDGTEVMRSPASWVQRSRSSSAW